MSYSRNPDVQTEQDPRAQFVAQGYSRNAVMLKSLGNKGTLNDVGDKSTHKMHFSLFLIVS